MTAKNSRKWSSDEKMLGISSVIRITDLNWFSLHLSGILNLSQKVQSYYAYFVSIYLRILISCKNLTHSIISNDGNFNREMILSKSPDTQIFSKAQTLKYFPRKCSSTLSKLDANSELWVYRPFFRDFPSLLRFLMTKPWPVWCFGLKVERFMLPWSDQIGSHLQCNIECCINL